MGAKWKNHTYKTMNIFRPLDRLYGQNLTSLDKEKRIQTLKKAVMAIVKDEPEETEKFLRHYDLEYCDDYLIFQELIWHVFENVHSRYISKLAGESYINQ